MNIKSFMGAKSLRTLLYPILIVALLSAISLRLNIRDAELSKSWGKDWRKSDWTTLLRDGVAKTAVQEELTFRGPAYTFLLVALFWTWCRKRTTGKTPFIARRIRGIAMYDIVAGMIAVAGTCIWAAIDHPYPLPTFAMGLIFAAVMLKTRNILWSIGAHAFINFCVVIGTRFGGTMLY